MTIDDTHIRDIESANGRRRLSIVDVRGAQELTKKRHSPLISAIMPVYNVEDTLEQAIDSVLSQSVHDLELICVDDASTDGSREILERFAREDARVKLAFHHENAGYGASMNDAFLLAEGDWIAILEPDDYISGDMYEALTSFANALEKESGEKIDVAKSAYIREIRRPGTKRGKEFEKLLNCSYRFRIRPQKQPFDLGDAGASHLLRHHPSIWSALYRKSFLEENEISFVEYPGAGWADNEFFYETILAAKNICYLDKAFYVYREETREEFEASARRDKNLPFDRWHSMKKLVDKSRFTDDPGVAASHVAKGFTYLSGALGANTGKGGRVDPSISEEMAKMFSAMDESVVINEAKISPVLKERFFAYRGYLGDERKRLTEDARKRYRNGLVGELAYTVRNNGPGFAIEQMLVFFGFDKCARRRRDKDV